LAVSAGFTFNGEEKNCEKLGSCACNEIDVPAANTTTTIRKNLIIF